MRVRLHRVVCIGAAAMVAACGLPTADETSAGAGGGPTGSGGSSSIASSGATGGPEACDNGVDDDGNGRNDCADSACQGSRACEALPAGWAPVTISEMPIDAATPDCADGSPAEKLFVGPAGAPTCEACDCTVGGTGSCSPPEASCWLTSDDCTGTAAITEQPQPMGCIDSTPSGGDNNTGSCMIISGGTWSGTCSATGGDMTAGPAWSSLVFVCAIAHATGDAGGCSAGEACMPTGQSCIESPGAAACPPGWQASEIAAYEGGEDTRSCSACACDIACTGGSIEIHDNTGCGGSSVNLLTSACTIVHDVFDSNSSSMSSVAGTPAANCSGGQATGAVEAAGARKVCCR